MSVPPKRSNPSMLDEVHSSRAHKKRKASRQPPPPYGSHEYWDNRYRKQFQTVDDAACQDVKVVSQEDSHGRATPPERHQGVETLPFHNWYFSYDELRVLILPLILGGRKEAFSIVAGGSDPEDQALADGDESSDGMSRNNSISAVSSQQHDNDQTERQQSPTIITEEVEGSSSVPGSEKLHEGRDRPTRSLVGKADKVMGDIDPHTREEVEAGDNDDFDDVEEGESDDDEEDVDREGLARDGPISVLEVGCGDVPLCCGLLAELVNLSKVTGVSHQAIVGRLVATDYSTVVIDAMKKTYSSNQEAGGVLQFQAADARKLPYADGTFDLVLEKGVLDAMLSDSAEGTENCVQIVKECGRVLSVGGVLVLVSHLNANTPNGVQWIENVVVAGLSKEDESNVAWDIEVHGSDGDPSCDGCDESVDSLSPGPAVYILHKRRREGDEPASQAFELKFFVY